MPAGQGEPAIPRARAEHALGQRFHLRRHLEGLRLVRAVPSDRWRAGPHLLSSTPTHAAGSSVGGRARPRTQALCSMPSSRLPMIAARSRARGSSTIPTAGRNTCPFATPSGWARPASNHPWAASTTATTTRWPRRSTACSRPRSSTVVGRGATSRPSNMPPSNGSTGSTTAACSSRSGTSPGGSRGKLLPRSGN